MQRIVPTVEMDNFRKELYDLLNRYNNQISLDMRLAIICHLAGELMAGLDGRIWSGQLAFEFATCNIQEGNRYATQGSRLILPSQGEDQ